ncbi:ABC-three component system protein [Alloscardovia omnicolens]|uniref:ABC-three component system protein n=1 Tax=Alloscardovia omnicolens TaxID=419015 RepID=UPI003A5F68AF
MKFFEFAHAVRPLVPGSLNRSNYLRELVSMLTSVPESELGHRFDPSVFPSSETLESMYSRERDFTKKFAEALYSRLDTYNFIDRLECLDLPAQEIIVSNFASYGIEISLDDFSDEVTATVLRILADKAKIKTPLEDRIDSIHREAAMRRNRDLILARSRGCLSCSAPLEVNAYDVASSSYEIVCLTDEPVKTYRADDFAPLCKTCAEKFELKHSDEDIKRLKLALVKQGKERDANSVLLLPLNLHKEIDELLGQLKELSYEAINRDPSYNVVPLRRKIDDEDLLHRCSDAMSLYKPHIEAVLKQKEEAGQLSFSELCGKAKAASSNLEALGLDETEIFERITKWLVSNTNSKQYVCGILVSFLIQICEVLTPKNQQRRI